MGEVYRARDSRLGREVAIKILPEAFSKDAARVARFEREARLLASINHPAIAAIYGAEESGDTRYLVLELVPGQTLKEKLEHRLSLKETLTICRQIAEGLEAAHEKGIVHRDLKPANVMVTPQGKVKVLDLGLAKAMEVQSAPDDLSQASTAVVDDTLPGVILGTVGYMSPEQARGRPIDKRTDIWAFGCILFECLTGERAFSGSNVSDVIASILRSEPKWPQLPADTPPDIRELLARCLEKDPSQRLRDIGDARIAIENNLASSAGAATRVWSAPVPRKRRKLAGTVVAAVSAVLVAALATWLALRSHPGAAVPERKYIAVLPFRDLSGLPDGRLVGEGLVETVSSGLGSSPGVQVISPAVAVAAADKETDPYRAAGSVGANLFVRGSVQRSGDRVRITYSVWNTNRRLEVAGGTLDGTSADLFDLQDKLISQVARSLKLSGPARPAGAAGLETASQQEKFLRAVGDLQHYNTKASVDEASRLLEELASEAPTSGRVQAALGKAYLAEFNISREPKYVELAVDACSRAQRSSPDSPDTSVTLGEIRRITGKPKEAIEAYEHALSLAPESFDALTGLAAACSASGDAARAEATYRRAIGLQPGYWGGYSKLAGFYAGRGDYARAAQMFTRVTDLAPQDSRAFSNLGGVLSLAGDFRRARDAFQKSLALAPTDSAYSNLGTVEFFLGRPEKAVAAFEGAIRVNAGQFQLWSNLGDAYRWTPGKAHEAASAYDHAVGLCRGEIAINPRNGPAYSYMGLCLAKTGHAAEAAQAAEKALALDSANPETIYNAAIVSNLAGREAEAVDRVHRALAAGYPAEFVKHEPELASLRKTGKLNF
jgi:tetratricopeptide (TPR) repeat protein